ncbi:chromosome partitioning protein ParA [Orientia tsutsugamushi]|uniref:Chromosome partitioning protein ParA n=1 Tax=Orientia tsutsugamushi str. TA716 TaxID=1359175 RepID=A0A0F3PAH9_ORITS|nr:ParA family protein [Orientia tsutsugamushi]KJV74124.1 sporulation initiation inhibitor protein soj [Orientia tsutsugamushi str. TA763]KJV76916.1 sporulation initiation inhibitor protein soj [Orientia tsutsugamushi str. TA716]SPP24852.1 chromosome partitioning protein ParA [Orientia tsutsugamushi]SPR07884.1 chromosome partitioning protein ParA [Orientia tsutsugamushi]
MSYNAQIIVIVNQKGGVGKTTTATNLATAFAATGKKTLLVDLDPQGNVGIGFGINKLSTDKSIYQVFVNHNINIPEQAYNIVQSLITPTIVPNLDIIISNMDLSATEIELVSQEAKESKLKSALSNIQSQYDYIIVDCLPSLGLLTLNALMAATQVIIPMQCEFLALVGLSQLLKIIDRFKKNFNPNLKIQGILLTMHDRRNKLTLQVEEDVRKHLADLVFKTVIPRNVRISEAPSFGKPVILYDHKCLGSIAYMHLAKEILDNN